jgi:predicted dehydrogenase
MNGLSLRVFVLAFVALTLINCKPKSVEKQEASSPEKEGPQTKDAQPHAAFFQDPFAYFVQVLKEGHEIEAYGLASLENNLRVVQILEAARISAESGKAAQFKELFP